MGYTQEQAEQTEKKKRSELLVRLLSKHGVEEKDVKVLTVKSKYAVSVLRTEGEIERFVLWQKVDMGEPFKITVDYNVDVDENPTPPPRAKRRANAKKRIKRNRGKR